MAYQTIVRVNSAGLSMISPHRALARSTHSQFILLADCITKARKGNAVEFLPNSAMCDAADTVQTLQFFGFAIARRRRRPPVVRGFNGGPPALDDQRTKVTSARVRRNYASSAALFDASSSREPASIPHQVRDWLSLENALAVMKTRHPAEVISRR
jgi:hypothetical protein